MPGCHDPHQLPPFHSLLWPLPDHQSRLQPEPQSSWQPPPAAPSTSAIFGLSVAAGLCFGRRLSAWLNQPNGRAGDASSWRHSEKTVWSHTGLLPTCTPRDAHGIRSMWNLRPHCPTVFLPIACLPDHQAIPICGLARTWKDRDHHSGSLAQKVTECSEQVDGEAQKGPGLPHLPPGLYPQHPCQAAQALLTYRGG